MSSSDFSLLCHVKDLIERDALIQFLVSRDIEVQASDRDMFVKYGDEINLSLGAYSAFFDGYPVMVKSMQLKRALEDLREFKEGIQKEAMPSSQKDYRRAFLMSCMMSCMFPIVMNLVALQNLRRLYKSGQKISYFQLFVGLILWACGFTMGCAIIKGILENPLVSRWLS